MDDISIVTQTLNNTLQRQTKLFQNYEVEIANLTAEVIRLQKSLEELTKSEP